ncbi:VWA domain-containing protein [Luteimonas aestuarii]|uniref:VWA domain-containing protein n=1 Tax=Luteimonas aestuarii TaxID=453837 RepID=A0A4V3ALJ4_9GAMM|nr:tetratricopeptide repeat protein [Luteimonas aestuarii]TDK23271.1 VWA domain-containing protein [Luteimonas aestuarii]
MIAAWEGLQWLRPAWFWALAALPVFAWQWWRVQRREQVWRSAVDPQLLPHLIDRSVTRQGHASLWLRLLAWTLAVLALAGPSWRSIEQPPTAGGTPLVLALELSQATLAADLPPSRLLQARARLATLLQQRQGQPTALVAYADDAFTVAPLSDDTGNIALFLDALAPDIMPVDGSAASRAIAHAMRLLARGDHARGDILLLAASADGDAEAAATRAAAAGHRVSVLGLGRGEGVAYRRGDGSIAQARLDVVALQRVAAAGGGRYLDWDQDAMTVLRAGHDVDRVADGRGVRARQDGGYWLLLPLLLLSLFAFRRGAAVVVLAAGLLVPMLPAHAVEGGLWQRADQARGARMREGIAAYREGNDAAALQAWQGLPGATAAYNRGNALARQGRYEDAIAAYDEALRAQPGMEDAIANRQAVQAAMQRRPPSGGDRDDSRAKPDDGEGTSPQGQGEDGSPRDGSPEPGGDRAPTPPSEQATPPAESEDRPSSRDRDEQPDAQQAADAAQREAMEQALQQDGTQRADDASAGTEGTMAQETDAEREQRQANEAWLRRIPDDPGGLLRARFKREHDRRNGLGEER